MLTEREAIMLQRYSRLAGLTLVLGLFFVAAAEASTHVSVQIGVGAPIGVPVQVAPAPYGGYIWQPGYYVWSGFGYRWVPGAWVPGPYARGGWARERWAHERWERERWERDHRDWDRDHRREGERGYRR
jgi:hypothetical protein